MTAYTDKAVEFNAIQSYGSETLASGTWTNGAKNDHHLTIAGATIVEEGPGPSLNRCLEFDGTDDYAECAHAAELNRPTDGVGTHVVWIWQFVSPAHDSFACIASKGGANYEIRRRDNINGFEFAPDAGNAADWPDSLDETGKWIMVVGRRDDTLQLRLFSRESGDTTVVDRTVSTSYQDYGIATNPFRLGGRGEGGRFWNGRITGYAMFPTSLTTAQMDEMYDAAMESGQLATPVVTIDTTTNPTTVGGTDGTADASWPAVTGAATYRVEIADGLNATTGFTVLAEDHATTSYQATGLAAGDHTVGVTAKP